MDYNEFAEIICEAIRDELPSDVTVMTREVLKNNGSLRRGIIFTEMDINASPTIYLEQYFEMFENGTDLREIAMDIISCFYKNRLSKGVDVEFFSDYERVSDKLYCKLINKTLNEDLLKEVPYEEFNDLAVIVYCTLDDFEFGNASITIRHSHLSMWGRSAKEVLDAAKNNTRFRLGCCIENITVMIGNMLKSNGATDRNDYGQNLPEVPMYVVTNRQKMNGSIFMIYDDLLDSFCDIVGEKYYILPSSVHEFILVPESDGDNKTYYDEMVQEVNESHVSREEILANHAYCYSRSGGFLV